MSVGLIQLSKGIFSVTAAINLASYVSIQGVGKATEVRTSTNGINVISAIGTQGAALYYISVKDLYINGNDYLSDAIHFEWCHWSKVEGVRTFAFQGCGFYLLCCYFPYARDFQADNCGKVSTNRPSMWLASTAGVDSTNEGSMYNINLLNNYTNALRIDGGESPCNTMYFYGLQIENPGSGSGDGIQLNGSNNQFIGGTLSSCGADYTEIVNAGYGNKIIGINFVAVGPIGTLISSNREAFSINDIVAYGGDITNGIYLMSGADHCTLNNIHLNGAFGGYGIRVASSKNILSGLALDATFTGNSVQFDSGGDDNFISSGILSKALANSGTGNKWYYLNLDTMAWVNGL